ncbi:hypothetical protein PpBr36_04837 [Pyricularia pennisetigena]|uniref:hypothetical protein n=1 Tax=Pyricularia pennisetigena TaxID=1578925 RepID=UPI00114F40BF|nr:hypothetical protein PpBr36_04837 [Pyricularia pennisetigena]TLS27606.1 hypothetical protein PpBr36_04837 [Pyricularia pennisetigena]
MAAMYAKTAKNTPFPRKLNFWFCPKSGGVALWVGLNSSRWGWTLPSTCSGPVLPAPARPHRPRFMSTKPILVQSR